MFNWRKQLKESAFHVAYGAASFLVATDVLIYGWLSGASGLNLLLLSVSVFVFLLLTSSVVERAERHRKASGLAGEAISENPWPWVSIKRMLWLDFLILVLALIVFAVFALAPGKNDTFLWSRLLFELILIILASAFAVFVYRDVNALLQQKRAGNGGAPLLAGGGPAPAGGGLASGSGTENSAPKYSRVLALFFFVGWWLAELIIGLVIYIYLCFKDFVNWVSYSASRRKKPAGTTLGS